jgi:hypothetical protein
MSNSKNEKTKMTSTNEISVSDFSEDVPGVTQLLSPNLAQLRKKPSLEEQQREKEKENTIAIDFESSALTPDPTRATMTAYKKETPVQKFETSAPNGLASFGIEFQLIFVEEAGVLRYQGAKEMGNNPFPAWRHSFFDKMKIDLRVLGITVSFQEFAADRFPLQKEAFGLESDDFVQCVRDPNDRKKMHVLFSKKSLLGKKNEIEEALAQGSGNSNEGSGEIKIELAS